MRPGDVLPGDARTPSRRGAIVKVCLLTTALAVPAAVVWWLVTPLPGLQVNPRGVRYTGSAREFAISADAWFAITTAVTGAIAAGLAFRVARAASPAVLVAVTITGMLASVATWRLGMFLGPAPIEVQAATLSNGDTFKGPLELSALGVLVAWPLAAVTVYFSLVAGLTSAPRSALARPTPDRSDHAAVLTPEEVANKQFTTTRLRPGYDEAEVDDFLDHVVVELRRLHQDIYALRAREATAARMASAARRRKDHSVLTADEVAHKQFTSTRLRPGYDEAEVDQFLDHVAAELRRLQQDVDALRAWPDGGTASESARISPHTALARPDDAARQWLNRGATAPPRSRGGSVRRVMLRLLGRQEGEP